MTGPPSAQPVLPTWSDQLADRLFTSPPRWGWQAADEPAAAATVDLPPPRPAWVEPPHPDTTALRQARSRAVSRLVRRSAFAVVAVFAFSTYQLVIEEGVDAYGDSAREVYAVVLLVVAALLGIGLLRAAAAIAATKRALDAFEQPYRVFRAEEQRRHRRALDEWQAAVHRHQAATVGANRGRAGPLWYPVHPLAQPTRVDVLGGDPHRHGWAGLLVTLGTSVLAAGDRITVLDLTGQDVGGGLLAVARARRLAVDRLDLPADAGRVDLLAGLSPADLADCLGYALTARREPGDLRHERALATEVLRRVADCLTGEVTFARLAAGVRVLRQVTPGPGLSPTELARLAEQVGELGQDESTGRQLRFLSHQLDTLGPLTPVTGRTPWSASTVSVVATTGGRDDRGERLDHLLVQLVQRSLPGLGGCLVVAGADHLGVATLDLLSGHARAAGVRLVLMIDHPQGELEKIAGTGGAVCLMKMYNHRDAAMAADFVGRGHRFVVNQITRQVGRTFTDGGGDNLSASTSHGSGAKPGFLGGRGGVRDLSESRGHTWTGLRTWSLADNLSTSTTTGRVYEFIVEPQQILGLPETAFILVDNSAHGRRVVMADGNPGICLLDRVSPTPEPDRR
ncbi:hypothetical protein [Micromonospora radicis]|uniref:TraD/TraG TraM recognition site domain-containing protein n=1 Tax=Micromonospora radicis TaxID=1894971 RepID=A0A418MYH3_9ACTN|nr:hypothetical protein [Micromonospora radicis]RIV39747.1 hypothetical protein D2L64_08055 [Micromonospora radicis]